MNKLTYFLSVSLGLTNLAFFSIGFAQFTLFHALFILFLIFMLARILDGKLTDFKISLSLAALLIYIPLSNLFFINSFKGTSLLYSVVIGIELISMSKIAAGLSAHDVKKIVKGVILLYAISVGVGYLFISFHIIPTGFLSTLCQTYNDGRHIRPMGFSSEPSYAALIIIFSLYVFLRCDHFEYKPHEAIWYVLSIGTTILLGSSYGYMMIILLSFFLMTNRNIFQQLLKFLVRNSTIGVFAILLFMAAIVYGLSLENKAFERLINVFSIVSSSDWDIRGIASRILDTDNSASLRIIPTIQLIDYFQKADFTNILIGNGAGQATLFYTALHGQLTLLGFFPAFVYNYGILGTVITFSLLTSQFPKKRSILMTLFVFFLFNADFNTQIFVYILFTAMLVKQLEKLESQTKLAASEDVL